MEREVGGGIRMGNTCKPMAVSFHCMTKSTTIKKKNPMFFKAYVIITVPGLNNKKANLVDFFFFFAFREISRFF